jgi:hypothetical protein
MPWCLPPHHSLYRTVQKHPETTYKTIKKFKKFQEQGIEFESYFFEVEKYFCDNNPIFSFVNHSFHRCIPVLVK